MIRVALRFDDPSVATDHELEVAIFALLERYAIPATVAATPFHRQGEAYQALSTDNAPHLIAAHHKGIIEIALHGYSHEQRSSTRRGGESEFAGLAANEQARLISEGRDLLASIFGCDITGFVPPWNTCDTTTLETVRDLGFQYVSAGFETPSVRKLTWLPRTCQFKNIVVAVEEARRYAWSRPLIIAVMHHYDFRELGSTQTHFDLTGLQERLAWLVAQQDLQIVTLDTMRLECRGCIGPGRLDSLKGILPWRLSRWLPERYLVAFP
jgi:peptidoglycan/xylan/chitin deacetylase (PgdA/CDA1 family)